MQNYKNLKVWEKSHELALDVYKQTKAFPDEEKYGLTSQLRRACLSIPANIADRVPPLAVAQGCGKFTDADFARFLNISLGSANEADYYILFARDLRLIDKEIYVSLEGKLNEIKGMLISLIGKVRKNDQVLSA